MAANNPRSADAESTEKKNILQQLAQLEMKYENCNERLRDLSEVYAGCTN